MKNKVINDPENYLKMSEPYESEESVNKAIGNFYDELSMLRKKYKVRDILVVVYGSVKYENNVGEFMQHLGLGDQHKQLAMAAYAYGTIQSEQKEIISKLLHPKQ